MVCISRQLILCPRSLSLFIYLFDFLLLEYYLRMALI